MYNEFYDRYEIIRELSCSRHSKVYLVRHRILDVYRVAKIFTGSHEESERLLNEAHLIKNLKHPHIPVIYDIEQNIGEDNDSICIIEEYIDGKSLRQYVNDETETNGCLDIHEICRIGIELCCILEYLHSFNGEGILHMDIKPDNIMLDNYGKVKLIDFDNAVIAGCGMQVNNGSLLFAAPEQYSGEDAVEQSDIYSVGMVILFMISHGKIRTYENHNLSGAAERYSVLYHLINKSLHHQWGLRYESVTLVREELESIMKMGGGTFEKLSYVIQVAGEKPGIGVTNAVMSMAHFFRNNQYDCVVVDKSGNDYLHREIVRSTLMPEGFYLYDNIKVIPDYYNAISVNGVRSRIVIIDCGCDFNKSREVKITDITGDNYTCIRVFIVGKATHCSGKKMDDKDIIMLNLVGARQFYELVNSVYKGKKCYRIPCIYNWNEANPIFDETMNDFLQDNLTGIMKGYRPHRIKECIGRLYEKVRNFRVIKWFRKKKKKQEHSCNKL